ncbi:MAG: DUF2231 domain-containing protein [Prochloraceae cyanobacterium]|nr:DUF2231 domain-containing protein [Prochloraceae cyanobacterium]
MNPELINQFDLGINGLPYTIPIHPNLVHLSIGLFIVAIACDILGVFFPLGKPIFKLLALPAIPNNFFAVGWYNMLAAAIASFFTVGAGFYEMMLADPLTDVKSAWGLAAMETMLWHGVGGVFLLILMVGMTVWRGCQRYFWNKDKVSQVQWTYLLAGLAIMFIMFLHGTLGAQLAAEFEVHNTAGNLLRLGENPNLLLQ